MHDQQTGQLERAIEHLDGAIARVRQRLADEIGANPVLVGAGRHEAVEADRRHDAADAIPTAGPNPRRSGGGR